MDLRTAVDLYASGPCRWITKDGAHLCIGNDGSIAKGPKGLVGKNIKDKGSAQSNSRIAKIDQKLADIEREGAKLDIIINNHPNAYKTIAKSEKLDAKYARLVTLRQKLVSKDPNQQKIDKAKDKLEQEQAVEHEMKSLTPFAKTYKADVIMQKGEAVLKTRESQDLYHVTDESNVSSILRNGLRPSKPSRGDEYSAPAGVYLTPAHGGIGTYKQMIKDDEGTPVVLKVTIPKGTILRQDPINEMDVFVGGKISKAQIKRR